MVLYFDPPLDDTHSYSYSILTTTYVVLCIVITIRSVIQTRLNTFNVTIEMILLIIEYQINDLLIAIAIKCCAHIQSMNHKFHNHETI